MVAANCDFAVAFAHASLEVAVADDLDVFALTAADLEIAATAFDHDAPAGA
jgi:hypothetical protein